VNDGFSYPDVSARLDYHSAMPVDDRLAIIVGILGIAMLAVSLYVIFHT
jgi:uncharacterized membrane protein